MRKPEQVIKIKKCRERESTEVMVHTFFAVDTSLITGVY